MRSRSTSAESRSYLTRTTRLTTSFSCSSTHRAAKHCLVGYSFTAVVSCRTSNRIMVVSGAGISVSCGVPDFRSPGGLYERIKREMGMSDPQAIFDFELFRTDPAPFYSICKVNTRRIFRRNSCIDLFYRTCSRRRASTHRHPTISSSC